MVNRIESLLNRDGCSCPDWGHAVVDVLSQFGLILSSESVGDLYGVAILPTAPLPDNGPLPWETVGATLHDFRRLDNGILLLAFQYIGPE